jgi:hypothetical protein
MRYQIGQILWVARYDMEHDSVECPDCGGEGRIRVTFHDDTEVSIECGNCRAGYDPPTGRVRTWRRMPRTELVTLTGYEVNGAEERYRTSTSYLVPPENLFEHGTWAMLMALGVAMSDTERERGRILTKEKDKRSWAWNASYHRRCLKEAQRNVEYHTSKLAVAAVRARERVQ